MITSAIKTFWREEDGQDLVEYALLLAFIALACVTVLGSLQGDISAVWTKIGSTLNSAATNATSSAS